MFVSFFPRPKLFFLSAIVWTALAMTVWYSFASNLFPASEQPVGVATFWAAPALWFDCYFALCSLIFAAAWMLFSPHPWARWSILGSALILFTSYFQVEVSVAINSWYGPFYDLVQAALSKSRPVTVEEFYRELSTFAGIALVAVVVGVMTRFFVSHYIFRWRTAMNDFYVANWPGLRTIEGASQRVQEDTMRFATTMESLGVNLISAVLTLLAFLPVLVKLSADVTELPLIGHIPDPLVWAAVIWSVVGTGALALIGIRLPGIEFFNQRVEAAYRKELVLGEDDPVRADPPTLSVLFGNVRRNYFRLYLNFMYFNIGRIVYLQTDVVFPYLLLAPTIIAGKITLGAMNQILNAFSEVRTSFQYLVNSWSTIVELISIYQRLRGFEAQIDHKPLAGIETRATVRTALQRHWDASDASDFEAEHEIYREDAVLQYPQSGERIRGRHNIRESRFLQPNKKRFTVRRIIGRGDLWVTEFVLSYDDIPSYAVSIMEFREGLVASETQYFADRFDAAPSRAQLVERTGDITPP